MALDLHPYGLNWILDNKKMTNKFTPDSPTYAEAKRLGDNISIMIGGQEKKFRINGERLGSGTYGVTYPVIDLNGDPIPKVVKVLKKKKDFDTNLAYYLREAVIQIIIVNETENEQYPEIKLYGPFAPRLFYIGVEKDEYYIVSERLTGDLEKSQPVPSWVHIQRVAKIAKILQVLYTKLRFNHRDLKLDNIMYNLNADNTENIKLIDFGLSCLDYKGIQIFNTTTVMKQCYKKSRDISAILYYIGYHAIINKSEFFFKIIRTLLDSQGEREPVDWGNTYGTYNSLKDYANLYPEVIYNIFSNINSRNYNTWVKYLPEINTYLIRVTSDEEFKHFQIDKLIQFISDNPEVLLRLSPSSLIHVLNHAEQSESLLKSIVSSELKHNNILGILVQQNKITLFEKIVKDLKYTNMNIFHNITKFRQIPEEFFRTLENLPDLHTMINTLDGKGRTPLECAFLEKDAKQANWFLNLPGIELQFQESTALIEAIANIDNHEIAPIVDKILELNQTPEFINFVSKNQKTAIALVFGRKKFAIINKLLSLDSTNITFINSTVLIELIRHFPDEPPSTYIENIPKSKLTPEFVSYNKSLALIIAASSNNLPLSKYLVEAGSEIPNIILGHLKSATKPLIDYFFTFANKPEYINAIDTEGIGEWKNNSVLMLAVKFRNLYLVRRLLEFPYLKTAYQNPIDGKTALHYAAQESSRYGRNSKLVSLSEAPEDQILKLLIDRNPALTEIRDRFKKGPGNPNYVGYGFTRKYIKSRKSGMFSKKHTNTNLAGGKRKRKSLKSK